MHFFKGRRELEKTATLPRNSARIEGLMDGKQNKRKPSQKINTLVIWLFLSFFFCSGFNDAQDVHKPIQAFSCYAHISKRLDTVHATTTWVVALCKPMKRVLTNGDESKRQFTFILAPTVLYHQVTSNQVQSTLYWNTNTHFISILFPIVKL